MDIQYDGFLMTGATWTGPIAGTVGFDFNIDLRKSGETVGGLAIPYEYDADGRMTRAGELILQRDDPATPSIRNGLLRTTALGVVTTTHDYNAFGEMTASRAVVGGNPVFEVLITNTDRLGRILEKVETIEGVTTTYNYGYDQRGRLSNVSINGVQVREYQYDSNGNRLIFQSDGTPAANYDAQDRLLAYDDAVYTYTATGELQLRTDPSGTSAYTYDVFGNLLQVELTDGTQIDYVVDGANRRVGKRVNGTLDRGWIYRDARNPAVEFDGSNNIVSRFVYATRPNVPEYMIRNGTTYRIISDHLGSPRLVIDVTSGDIVQRMNFDEFGNVLLDSNPGFQPFGFAGGLYDGQTELVRFGLRDYDPKLGRWTAKDPMLFTKDNRNFYAYSANDPVNTLDFSGGQSTCARCPPIPTSEAPKNKAKKKNSNKNKKKKKKKDKKKDKKKKKKKAAPPHVCVVPDNEDDIVIHVESVDGKETDIIVSIEEYGDDFVSGWETPEWQTAMEDAIVDAVETLIPEDILNDVSDLFDSPLTEQGVEDLTVVIDRKADGTVDVTIEEP